MFIQHGRIDGSVQDGSNSNEVTAFLQWAIKTNTERILGLRPANERQHYFVMTSLTGWAQT